jgi:hypothetical protein
MSKSSTALLTFLAGFVLLGLVLGCGTGTTASGTHYSVNISRQLEVYEPEPLDDVHKAAVAAVQSRGYTIKKAALDAREGVVEGLTATDKAVKVLTFAQGDDVTRVRVYVGGDEAAAKELLDKIEEEL